MKKKKNTTTNKTGNKRWRPPKTFVSKKPVIKRDKPGRPKKHEKIILPQIPEKKENKLKDFIIRTLFFISFLIFWFSVYVSQKNKSLAKEDQIDKSKEIITNNIQYEQPESPKETIKEENYVEIDERFSILQKIYNEIQSENFEELYKNIDNNLKQSSIFRTYFSNNRLQRFINNIEDKNINIELLKIEDEESKVSYRLSYFVKGTKFIEERETTFANRNNEQKIAKIMCITKGCSTMPFFNPGKYF